MSEDLVFRFKEMEEELDAFVDIASPFLEADAPGVITRFREELRSLEDAEQDQRRAWTIGEELPVVSKPTRSYAGAGGREPVWASFSTIWEVAPVGQRSKKTRNRLFAIGGKASTRVEIWRGDRYSDCERVAMWRMEIGGENHPGVHFHVQVLGDSEQLPFPTWLDVPRLPGFVATPAQVMEFALGELFQDEWARGLADRPRGLGVWNRIQRPRFQKLLEWQIAELRDGAGSPWSELKLAKPSREMLV